MPDFLEKVKATVNSTCYKATHENTPIAKTYGSVSADLRDLLMRLLKSEIFQLSHSRRPLSGIE